MKNFVFHLAVFVFLITSCKSAKNNYIHYYQKINEAEFYLTLQKYDSAIIYFESAFKDVPKVFDLDRYHYIICLNNNKRTSDALELIKKYPAFFELSDSNYFKNISTFERENIAQKAILYDSLQFDSIKETTSFKRIIELYENDQKYRKKLTFANQNEDSLSIKKYVDSLNNFDIYNQKAIIKMIKRGQLSAGVNNPYSMAYLTSFFVHQPSEFLEKNQKLFEFEILKGNLLPCTFYIGVDRKFYDECGGKSLYLQYGRIPFVNDPIFQFKLLSERGLSPYFYSFGMKKMKNENFDYYRINKTSFNCSTHKPNLKIIKNIDCNSNFSPPK